jgi:DNA invertase Pin-like site-specific DNA recombinase
MPEKAQVRATETAREYLRVSADRSGRERSNDEQHDDNARAAEAEGWALGAPYRDEGSASAYAANGNGRVGFDRLVDDVTHDRFGADVLILWEASRGSRRLSVWAQFLELLGDRGVRLHVTSHGRTYDLSNPRDRRSLHEDGTDSEYESGKISLRTRRATASAAAKGEPHGHIPFGYRRRYDPETRRFVEQVPEADEAEIVRELFRRLAAGHSLRSIARDLDARGVRSRDRTHQRTGEFLPGKPFSSQSLRNMALNPSYAGKRLYAPGSRTATARRANGTLVEAVWHEHALVDEATFLAVERRLTNPARRTSPTARGGKHLLSMSARCDVCSGPLAVTYRRGRREYGCQHGGHLRIIADDLDTYAEGEILAYLCDDKRARRLRSGDGDSAALAAADDEVARIDRELDDLADRVGSGELTATLAARAEPTIRKRLDAAKRHRDELVTPDDLYALIAPGLDVAQRWEAAPMQVRRQVVRLVLTPELLGELRVTRNPTPGKRAPAAERIVWRRIDG